MNAFSLKRLLFPQLNMSDFIPFVQELLDSWGPVSARRMFGGHGLYHEGLMFAIVMNQQLYLKVDDQNRPDFEALGLTPFTYPMKGKDVALSYWAAPDAVFDDPQEAVQWARSAWDAALRAHLAKVQAREKAKSRQKKRFTDTRTGGANAAKTIVKAGDDRRVLGEFDNPFDLDAERKSD